MKTQNEYLAMLQQRAVTPKGEGTVIDVRGYNPNAITEPRIEIRVLLDTYVSSESYAGTWFAEEDVTIVPQHVALMPDASSEPEPKAPRVGTVRLTPSSPVFTRAFSITLRDLTDIAFVAGAISETRTLSEKLTTIVDRVVGGAQ